MDFSRFSNPEFRFFNLTPFSAFRFSNSAFSASRLFRFPIFEFRFRGLIPSGRGRQPLLFRHLRKMTLGSQ